MFPVPRAKISYDDGDDNNDDGGDDDDDDIYIMTECLSVCHEK